MYAHAHNLVHVSVHIVIVVVVVIVIVVVIVVVVIDRADEVNHSVEDGHSEGEERKLGVRVPPLSLREEGNLIYFERDPPGNCFRPPAKETEEGFIII